jgi:cytochrome c peroxidase
MGGPKIPWRSGRIDGFVKDATPDGRLPDASLAQDHLRSVSANLSSPPQPIVLTPFPPDFLPHGV